MILKIHCRKILCIIRSACGDNGVVGEAFIVEVLESDGNWPNKDDILWPICLSLLKKKERSN